MILFLVTFRVYEDKSFAPIISILVPSDAGHKQWGTNKNAFFNVVSYIPIEDTVLVDDELTGCDLFVQLQDLMAVLHAIK